MILNFNKDIERMVEDHKHEMSIEIEKFNQRHNSLINQKKLVFFKNGRLVSPTFFLRWMRPFSDHKISVCNYNSIQYGHNNIWQTAKLKKKSLVFCRYSQAK